MGIWLFISGLIPAIITQGNMIASGIAVFILGIITLRTFNGIILAIIGAWLFFSALLINLAVSANFIVCGILVFLFAIWGANARARNTVAY